MSAIRRDLGLAVAFPNLAAKPWALRLSDEFKSGACHAGQFETSIVLAERPELVRDGHQGSAATQSGVAFPRHPGWQAELRGGGRRPGLLRVSGPGHRRGRPGDHRSPRRDSRRSGPGRARRQDRAGEMNPLAGRVAVVTGAGRGIGAATARALADAGLSVVLAARTSRPDRAADRRAGGAGPPGEGGGLRRDQRGERARPSPARPPSWDRSRCWSTTPAPPPRCPSPGPRSKTGTASWRSTPPAPSSAPGPFFPACSSGSGVAWSTWRRPRGSAAASISPPTPRPSTRFARTREQIERQAAELMAWAVGRRRWSAT